jgi:Protein of unknown function (DUF2442)
MMLSGSDVIEIVRAQAVGPYELRLEFSDGVERVVDFEPFLAASRNPMIRAYLDPERFAKFRTEYGDLVWDDYDLCFPIGDLYEGHV